MQIVTAAQVREMYEGIYIGVPDGWTFREISPGLFSAHDPAGQAMREVTQPRGTFRCNGGNTQQEPWARLDGADAIATGSLGSMVGVVGTYTSFCLYQRQAPLTFTGEIGASGHRAY